MVADMGVLRGNPHVPSIYYRQKCFRVKSQHTLFYLIPKMVLKLPRVSSGRCPIFIWFLWRPFPSSTYWPKGWSREHRLRPSCETWNGNTREILGEEEPCWSQWHNIPVTPDLGRLREEDHKFEARDYIIRAEAIAQFNTCLGCARFWISSSILQRGERGKRRETKRRKGRGGEEEEEKEGKKGEKQRESFGGMRSIEQAKEGRL